MTLFTKIGVVVASLAFLGGLAAVVASFYFPFDINAPDFRSSFNFRQSSVLLSQGLAIMFAGLLLGVLCEISLKLKGFVAYASDKEQE
ncbi:MAG: hypothetical protein ACRCS3_12785 [Paracoccaceae bacterium]